jgi:hypothetical protein
MASKQFQKILHHVTNLNYSQLKKLRHEVESNIASHQVGQAIAIMKKQYLTIFIVILIN